MNQTHHGAVASCYPAAAGLCSSTDKDMLSPPNTPSPSPCILDPTIVAPSSVDTQPYYRKSPLLTPPPPPPFSSLTALPEDVLRRIIDHLLSDSHRGAPYYPPTPPLDALPLAETAASMRAAVAKHMHSDTVWLAAAAHDASPLRLRHRLLAWYRLAGPHLRLLTLSSRSIPSESCRCAVMRVVTAAAPPLRSLDLTGVGSGTMTSGRESELEALRELLPVVRASVAELHVQTGAPDVLDVVSAANMAAVRVLEVRHVCEADGLQFLSLLHSLRGREGRERESSLGTFVLKTSEPLPSDLRPAAFVAAAPAVRAMHYEEISVMRAGCEGLSSGFVEVAAAYERLEEVGFKNATVDVEVLEGFWDAQRFPCLKDVSLQHCKVPGLPRALSHSPIAGRSMRRLELMSRLGATEMVQIGRTCGGLLELSLRLERTAVHELAGMLRGMPQLQELTLILPPRGENYSSAERGACEEAIVRGLEDAGKQLRRVVLHSESVSVAGLTRVFEALGARFEYLVTAVYVGGASHSACILKLLEVVERCCTNMKVLCFGLELKYDERAGELHEELVAAIEKLARKLRRLDPVWLMRNAASLMDIQKPQG